MKVNVGQIQRGLAEYIENEIVAKITDWRKWVFGTGASMLLMRSGDVFNTLKANPVVAMLGVIDENDMVDLDLVYQEVKKQAARGSITIYVPMMGPLTLNETDVDKLYNYIKTA